SRWLDFFREPLRRVQDESRAYLASEAGRRPDGKVIVVLVTATLALVVQHFIGKDSGITLVRDLLRNAGLTRLSEDLWDAMWGGPEPQARLNRLRWWGWISLLVYVAVPMLLVRLAFRERLRDYGLKLGGVFADFWVYAVMMALAWPAIYWA